MLRLFLLLFVSQSWTSADASGARSVHTTLNSNYDMEVNGESRLRLARESLTDRNGLEATATAAVLRALGSTEHWTLLLVISLLVLISAAGIILTAFSLVFGDAKLARGSAQGLFEWASSGEERQSFKKAADMGAANTATDDGMLSHALLVRAPGGSAYIISGEISPHPQEEEVVTVTNAITNKPEAHALISELSFNPTIHVETVDRVVVATLDTACAIYPENTIAPPSNNRFVLVKNAEGKLFARVDAEFNSVKATCKVQRLSEAGKPLGPLLALHYDEKEELVHIVGPAGDIVGQPQLDRRPDGSQRRLLAVRQGADLALVLCAALAFRKLS
eukprot:gnl/TRDRNA2_/TRDRNA2_188328_c0_seq1.p1 gnl/TRDRNA2_/TRDRNA2_188328_c0~~gnl/TRDRNA2_/TRDRNA2_188328_c0_seq1.p1  ORF type:complete len:334 (+),score=51.89 gnl/TRDRNA2_/TRDRNA2_188328_c0_seq1:92-1093(+)